MFVLCWACARLVSELSCKGSTREPHQLMEELKFIDIPKLCLSKLEPLCTLFSQNFVFFTFVNINFRHIHTYVAL